MDNGESAKIDANLRRVCFFIERTDNAKPVLPSNIPLTHHLREYLNDDDFSIEIDGVSVFIREDERERIERLYGEWVDKNEESSCVDSFIIEWIRNSPHLDVHYSLYDDITKHE